MSNPPATTTTPSTGCPQLNSTTDLNAPRAPVPPSPPLGAERPGRGGGCFFLSLRRRALAPLAWLRAVRRAAQSRRPVCSAARSLSWPTPCRLPGAKLIISLDGGRELRSLAYAPCGAARGRVLRTMVRWRAGAGGASIPSCKTKPDRPRQPRRSGAPPSRGCRPPCARPSMRPSQTAPPSTKSRPSSGARAARARAPAVGRYTKNMRDLIRQQQDADRANEAWVRALGPRAQGRAGSS